MVRRPRHDFEGAWHHVMHRGARREPVFAGDAQYDEFLQCLAETSDEHGIEIHAYALMSNHYHLLIRSARGDLSRAMQQLNGTFTQRLNYRYGWDGPVFRGRFYSKLVSEEPYLAHLLAYIHLNPLRAGLIRRLDARCYSSHRAYLGLDTPPAFLHTAFFLDWLGGSRAVAAYTESWREENRPWLKGSAETPAEVLPSRKTGAPKKKAPQKSPGAGSYFVPPELILAAVQQITDSEEADLKTSVMGPGGNPPRNFAVFALSTYTQLSQTGIAKELSMTPAQVSKAIQRYRVQRERYKTWEQKLRKKAYAQN